MDVTHALDLDAPAIGFRHLSSNSFLNQQANRWLTTEQAVYDFLPVLPLTTRIADWVRTYLDLADRVQEQGHDLEAAFFVRGAEFFMQPVTRSSLRIAKGSSPLCDAASRWSPISSLSRADSSPPMS